MKRFFTSFAISHDLGATFQPLADPPFSFNSYQGHTAPVKYAAQGPANLFTSGDGKLYHSPDSGHSWQPLGDAPDGYLLTPYTPFAVLGFFGTRLRVIDLPTADRSETRGTAATAAPGSGYATPTQHNIPAVFKGYWDGAGGLPQFGYPQTEAFREVSRSDGKVYLVQYFERNRFEYHPEYAGTPYAILLGLLGNDLTADRRAHGEGPFNPVPDSALASQRYFPATGHILRNSFLRYWDANGGLAIYGYPISEEFSEVNPENGQTYVVQYFERNRFEWHPENLGTPYEVLLGLLGNTLLEQQGWR